MVGTLLFCAALTIVVETLFFLLVGPRKRDFLIVCMLINGITNLALNILLCGSVLFFGVGLTGYMILTWVLECCVVPVEYLVYCHLLYDKPILHIPLLIKTIFANFLTCGIGILMEHLHRWPWAF